MILKTLNYKGLTIDIYPDDTAENPIDEYGGGIKLVSFHRRRGERHGFKDWEAVLKHAKETGGYAIPIRAYQHGNIAFTAVNPENPQSLDYPFNDQWDSGWYGLLLFERAYIREWWPEAKRLSPQRKQKLYESAVGWMKSYQAWVNGEYVGYVITGAGGKRLDSCWGYDDLDYCIKSAKEAADYYAEEEAA